ncbi:Mitochodrial transcription termination factor-related [Spatholobus suberectus]|nr:Mitochodrial transcription termination factor-related [Spatholobus suberectus]
MFPPSASTPSSPLPEVTHKNTPSNPEPNHFPSILSLKYSSATSEQRSFAVSYLVNNCGFSPETALKASKFTQFETAKKPDSVIAFFRNNGFTSSQINSIVRRAPNVLTCDPHKRVFPKFEFFLSKGASSSDVVELVSRSPRILYSSLENNIIPSYELVRRFLQSDKKTMDCIISCGHFFDTDRVVRNVRLLTDDGVTDSNISYLLRRRLSIILCSGMKGALDEVKEMGFDPSKLKFVIALLAKRIIPKSRWEAKVDAFKSWGWSEELFLRVFKKQPLFMLVSQEKINRIMRFWVNRLGWDPLALTGRPEMFGFSLEKRIIPRALVVQYLLAKGLRKKSASLLTPICCF